MNQVGIGLRVDAEASGVQSVNSALQDTAEGFSDISGKARASAEEIRKYQEAVDAAIKSGSSIKDLPTFGGGGGGGAFNPPPGGGSSGPSGNVPDEDVPGKRRVIPFPGADLLRLERTLKRLPGGLSKDVGGTAVEGAEDIAGQIGKLWGKLPMAAKVLGGVGIAAAGTMAVGNELSKQYEAVIPTVMSVTASLGRFGKTAEEQSSKFRSTMTEISGVSAKYGYTLQQGAAVVDSLAKGGARGEIAKAGAESVLAMSKGYGMTEASASFVDVYANASRYGLNGSQALRFAAGGARATIGDARVQEYADAMNQILEDGLSNGIVKGFDEISSAQNFLYKIFGEQAGGQRGADLYSSMSAGVRGATGLNTETDLMLFNATKKTIGSGASPVDILAAMEGGFSEDIYKNFMGQLGGIGDDEKAFWVQKAFGVSLSQAKKMISAKTGNELTMAYEGGAPGAAIAGTNESKITGYQENIANAVRGVGASAFDAKAALLSGGSALVDLLTGKTTIADMLNLEVASATINAGDLKIIEQTEKLKEKAKTDPSIDPYANGYGSVMQNLRNKMDFVYGDIMVESAKKGKGVDADPLNKLLYNPDNWATLLNVGNTKRDQILSINNMEKGNWTPNELSAALKMLTEVIQANTAAKEKDIDIPVVVPQQYQGYIRGGVTGGR